MTPAMRPEPQSVLLDELARTLGIPAAGQDAAVTGVTLDSRAVVPGDLYAALPGHVTHGARFASAAVSAGAAAVLTDPAGAEQCVGLGVPVLVVEEPRARLGSVASRIYGNPAAGLQLIGVTGTNGKTTVSSMIESGLSAAGIVSGLIGTIGVHMGSARFEGARTTPESSDLHAILAVMRESGVTSVVMEVSSIALEEHRVDAVVYDVAAFTNLSQDHLDYHGSMTGYFDAKRRLFTRQHARLGIIGIDDDWGRRLAASCEIPAQTWSLNDPRADWHARRVDRGVVISGPEDESDPVALAMPGSFNIANAVCAYAVLRAAGVDRESAARGVAQARVPGRMQVVGDPAGILGIVDYAHSPDAIERVLTSVRRETGGRVIAVIGAGGDRDRSKRALMGRTAAGLSDVLIITDDNPRSEDPALIREAILEGTRQVAPARRAEIREVADRGVAVTVAVGTAERGDVVLVLGKGHEQGQEMAGVVTPFDDATVLAAALARRSAS